ncbi:MAG: stage II sporulation protein M [Candidatus Aenigmarchaeota archaeon]|nr:stage II sporulation protein M [Candidatus Aenigmarchaeota archaeon]
MVLESLYNIKEVRKHPSEIFILGVIGTILAIIISFFLNRGGLFLVFLITLAILPLTIKQLKYEERRYEYDHFWNYLYSLGFFSRHKDLIVDYFCLILGIVLSISVSYLILPTNVSSSIFSDQILTISSITGHATANGIFSKILFNNIGVMVICFAFSLFYSSGAIFLISWNASVLGVVVGQGAKNLMGLPSIPLVLFSYLPHGIFEFSGYILAGIAGGILSIALARHKESRKHFLFVLQDSLLLLAMGIVFIFIGAIIEVMFI